MENGVFVTSSANRQVPAYDSYSDYAEELRVRNKDYSIVPEFRISDHIPYYVSTNSGDFHVKNTASFDILVQLYLLTTRQIVHKSNFITFIQTVTS